MPLPPSAPPDLRIFARAIWPQIHAGIAVNSQPHVNERTAKMRLQIAQAEYEEPFAEQPAAGALVFRLPSRRCSERNGKIKTHRRIEFGRRPVRQASGRLH